MGTKQFPIKTQLGNFTNEQDLEEWLISDRRDAYFMLDYFGLINHAPFIFSPFVQDCITRYNLQKNYGIKSFSEIYEETPAIWLDMLVLMDSEINRAMKEKAKDGYKQN